jgi:hypothetical protein
VATESSSVLTLDFYSHQKASFSIANSAFQIVVFHDQVPYSFELQFCPGSRVTKKNGNIARLYGEKNKFGSLW